MADKNYPIRLDYEGATGVRRGTPVRREPVTPQSVGATVGGAIATGATAAARQTARLANPAAAAIGEMLAEKQNRVAIRDFLTGAVTGEAAPAIKRAKPAAAASTGGETGWARGPRAMLRAANAYAEDMAKQPETVTDPTSLAGAMAASILSGPVTLREAQAAVGMIPKKPNPLSPKDTALAEYNKITDSLYQQQIAQAAELAKTDKEAGIKAQEAATKQYLLGRGAALQGALPTNLSFAELLAEAQGQ